MPTLLLGLDVGTYSSKAVLVTLEGRVVRQAAVSHGLSTPAPGFVEHNAEGVWWHDVKVLCGQLFDDGAFSAHEVAGMAVSAIGPCLVPLDESGQALRPAILLRRRCACEGRSGGAEPRDRTSRAFGAFAHGSVEPGRGAEDPLVEKE